MILVAIRSTHIKLFLAAVNQFSFVILIVILTTKCLPVTLSVVCLDHKFLLYVCLLRSCHHLEDDTMNQF